MANVIVNYNVVTSDGERETTTNTFHRILPDTTTLAEMITGRDLLCTAVGNMSGGIVQKCTISVTAWDSFAVPAIPSPGTAYSTSEDKAFLVFREPNGGGKFTTQIPVPLVTNFTSDNETVNPADTNVSALITLLASGGWCTKDGASGLVFTIGYRRRSSSRKEHAGVSQAVG